MRFFWRFMLFGPVALISVAGLGAPANAAWEYYISHPLGFSVAMPGEIAPSRGTYSAELAGTRDTIVFASAEEGIDYRITVVDMRSIEDNAANLLGEAAYNFQAAGRVMMDVYARVDRHFGRKLSIELPDGGRETAEYYFLNGQLLEFRAAIPPGGDYGSPDVPRFIDSVAFYPDMASQDSVQLTLPD
jgi:hypothetical protein